MQYMPEDGLYVYFRYDEKQTVMCVMNTSEKAQTVDFTKYSERTKGFTTSTNVVDGSLIAFNKPATIKPHTMWVLALQP